MGRSEKKIKEMLSKNIDPVYSELSAKIGEADSKIMPHVFEKLVNLEQVRILNAAPAGVVWRRHVPAPGSEPYATA